MENIRDQVASYQPKLLAHYLQALSSDDSATLLITDHCRRNFPSFGLSRRILVGIGITGMVGGVTSEERTPLTTRDIEYLVNAAAASTSSSTSMIMWLTFSVAALLLVGMGVSLFVQHKAAKTARIENRERIERFEQSFRDAAQIINRRVQEKEEKIDRRMEEREDRLDRRMQLFEERMTQRINDRMQLIEERMTQRINDAVVQVVPPVGNSANCNIS